MNQHDQPITEQYEILPTVLADLDIACWLFQEAIAYQKRNGYPEYRWDDREVQKQYILDGMHYKVVVQGEIAAVFNVHFKDTLVWRELDENTSVYLHGVLINPKHKGKRMFGNILRWSIAYAKAHRKTNIRLDTWLHNPMLLDYYRSFDFQDVEDFQQGTTEGVPLNCRGNWVKLMEYSI